MDSENERLNENASNQPENNAYHVDGNKSHDIGMDNDQQDDKSHDINMDNNPPIEKSDKISRSSQLRAERSSNYDNRRPTGFFGTLHMALFVVMVIILTIIYATSTFPAALISRALARKIARAWNRRVLNIGGVRVKVIGKEKLDKNERYVFMSNHQSALDIPIIYTGLGAHIYFIAKKELFAIPLFGWSMWAIGHISIDRGNSRKAHASIARAVSKLKKEKVSLILFPEGTRSKDGKVLNFKPASFSLAMQAGAKLVPVAIKGAIDRLPPKSSRIIPGEVTLEIGDPINAEDFQEMNKTDICAKVRDIIKGMVEG